MTPPNPLTELAAIALNIRPDWAKDDPVRLISEQIGRVSLGRHGATWGANDYTASLDAAMTLRLDWMSVETTESAPEPKFTRCRVWDWRRSPTMSDPGNEWKAEGNRPLPVNICAAILLARAALESSHGR